jgi:hypothetical protein
MKTPLGDRQSATSMCPHCGRPISSTYYFERRRLSVRRTYTALVPSAIGFGEHDSVEELRTRALM